METYKELANIIEIINNSTTQPCKKNIPCAYHKKDNANKWYCEAKENCYCGVAKAFCKRSKIK